MESKTILYFVLIMIISFTVYYLSSEIAIRASASSRLIPIYRAGTNEKKAAITFDCAWGAEDIPQIMAILKERKIKATFFVVGEWAERNKEMVRLIDEQGHDIANHSQNHFKMSALNRERIRKEIIECNNTIKNITGKETYLFRAPYGDYNNTIIEEAKSLSCMTIQWDVDSLDWKPNITKTEIIDRITKKIKPGSIILFHNDTKHTVSALGEIIDSLISNGYSFLPISQLVEKDNYNVDSEGTQK